MSRPIASFAPILAITLLLAACRTPTPSPAPTLDPYSAREVAIAEWLGEHAVNLETDDPLADLAPLQFLQADLAGHSIVDLGEQTHGTHEFFTIRQRVIRYLIEEMDFNLIAVEAPWAPAFLLDNYIHGADIDLEAALIDMQYWTFATEENLAWFEWLRDYNLSQKPEDQVSFYGIDIPLSEVSKPRILAALEGVDPALLAEATRDLSCVPDGNGTDEVYTWSVERIQACAQAVKDLSDLLQQEEQLLSQALSPKGYDLLLQDVRVIAQLLEFAPQQFARTRDAFMAENAAWILEHAPDGSQMVVWTHNAHIGERTDGMLGNLLAVEYGDDYYSVATAFYSGGFLGRRAPDDPDDPLSESGPHVVAESVEPNQFSYEHFLGLAPLDYFWLNLAGEDLDASGATWLLDSRPFRLGGALVNPDYVDANFYTLSLTRSFDAVLFVRYSTPSNPLIHYQ